MKFKETAVGMLSAKLLPLMQVVNGCQASRFWNGVARPASGEKTGTQKIQRFGLKSLKRRPECLAHFLCDPQPQATGHSCSGNLRMSSCLRLAAQS